MDEEDKKFFTSLPTCYTLFFLHLILGMFQKVIAPLQIIMKVGRKYIYWKQFFLGIHVGTGHSKQMNYNSMQHRLIQNLGVVWVLSYFCAGCCAQDRCPRNKTKEREQ
jgi:hypothetical protein